ncbi:MAG TPA: hypothetical protein VHX61_05135 [Rhizomicrobium sp.]|jgi:hypothetical protein|nr:hypothetical protein [Rhizomicrobium sp.]
MQNTIAICILFSISFVPTEPALADWQYAHWGMTPSQVATASSGAAAESAGQPGDQLDGYVIGDIGRYSSGEYHFRSIYYFDKRGLAMIELTLNGAGYDECIAVQLDLEGRYGRPYDRDGTSVTYGATWQDAKANNFVSIETIGRGESATCSIRYRPLKTNSANGL